MEITISQLCSRVKFSSSLVCLNRNSKRNNLNGAVSVNCLKEIDQISNISFTAKTPRSHAPVVRKTRASVDENQSPTSGGERWLLQPVGQKLFVSFFSFNITELI